MLITLFNHSSIYGGQERYAEELTKQLEKNGYSVVIKGGPQRLLGSNDEKLLETKPNIIILNGNAALYKNAFKKSKGCFYVYVQHSDINDAQQAVWKRIIRKILIKALLLRIDLVVRVCEKALPERYAPNKITTIYNGVQLPLISSSPLKLQKKVHLLMVGAINSNKNQKMAIKALVLLPNAELTILGDGDDISDLKKSSIELGVDSQINWVGFIKDPAPFYKKADALLMLSHFEAFPYVVLEAMSHKTPVIATKVGGVPEIINHGINGWLLDDYLPNSLADTVIMIQNNLDHYIEVADNSRKTIEENFTVEHMTKNLLNAINIKMEKHD